MYNIFENTYFGKAYKTRDGRKALVWYYHVGQDVVDQVVLITTNASQILVDGSGKDLNEPYHNTLNDIVSEWQEEINEEELDRISYESASPSIQDGRYGLISLRLYKEGFKAGYIKAKE